MVENRVADFNDYFRPPGMADNGGLTEVVDYWQRSSVVSAVSFQFLADVEACAWE
jgi:hypothetical protein